MKKLSISEKLLIFTAFISLVTSEVMWFMGYEMDAVFIGLWVPSIIGFSIYLKLLKMNNNV